MSLGPLSGNRFPHEGFEHWKSLEVLACAPRRRPRPSSIQATNEGREPHRPRPFWVARSLIGPSTRCLPAPARGAGRGEWSSGDPSGPALPSLASAPGCLQRHSQGPLHPWEGTQATEPLPARPPRRRPAMAKRSSLSIRIVEGKNLPAKDM